MKNENTNVQDKTSAISFANITSGERDYIS